MDAGAWSRHALARLSAARRRIFSTRTHRIASPAAPVTPAVFMRNWNSNVALATGNLQKTYALVTDFIQP